MSRESNDDAGEERARLTAELASVQREIEDLYALRDEIGMSAAQAERYRTLLAAEERLREALGISADKARRNNGSK